MAAPLDLTRPHRQQRLGAVERLDLGLFIHAEHQGTVGRVEVEPDNVADLVDKQRIGGELEGLDAMRLQAEGAPDAADARGRDAAVTRHAACAPVRGSARPALQRLHDDALDLGVIDLARHAGARLIEQPVNPALEKAPAPLADGLPRSPARAPPPPCCSGPRRIPGRSAPAMPGTAPSSLYAYSLPGCSSLQPTHRSSLPDDPFASPPPPRHKSISSNYSTNLWRRTLG